MGRTSPWGSYDIQASIRWCCLLGYSRPYFVDFIYMVVENMTSKPQFTILGSVTEARHGILAPLEHVSGVAGSSPAPRYQL